MARLRDDDELSDDEQAASQSPFFRNASDADICREADLGNPVADDIFQSWPAERRTAAARLVDAEDRARY